jgi:hypothetical protein
LSRSFIIGDPIEIGQISLVQSGHWVCAIAVDWCLRTGIGVVVRWSRSSVAAPIISLFLPAGQNLQHRRVICS